MVVALSMVQKLYVVYPTTTTNASKQYSMSGTTTIQHVTKKTNNHPTVFKYQMRALFSGAGGGRLRINLENTNGRQTPNPDGI